MRHRKNKHRLNEKPGHGRMQERNLVTSFLLYESLRTTKKRAATIAPVVEKLITFARKHEPRLAIRHINSVVTDKNASRKVMEVYVRRFAAVPSGITRIKAAGSRLGDGAEMVDLSFAEGAAVEKIPTSPMIPKNPKKSSASSDSSVPSKKKGLFSKLKKS